MRLMGSFQTITTHGRSASTAVSCAGSFTSTGAVWGAGGMAELSPIGRGTQTGGAQAVASGPPAGAAGGAAPGPGPGGGAGAPPGRGGKPTGARGGGGGT